MKTENNTLLTEISNKNKNSKNLKSGERREVILFLIKHSMKSFERIRDYEL